MKLMINVCGHSLCESCVNLQYARGQAPCYECGLNLKRSGFRIQLFDDPMVDREVHLRKKVLKIYNRRIQDFSSEFDFNNYLEQIEDIIIGLMGNKQWALDAMEKYKRENQSDIKRNSAKLNKERATVNEQIHLEKQNIEDAKLKLARAEQENKLQRLRQEQALLHKLEAGEDISSIIKFKEKIINREDTIETATVSLTANEEKKTESYIYQPIVFANDGLDVPSSDVLIKTGYTGAIRQPSDSHMASGYTAELGLRRALTDSFSSLFWRPKLTASEFEPVIS